MAKYKLKPMVLEALSFKELMEYGTKHTKNVYNNMPWSFEFMGCVFTHETDTQYVVTNTNLDDASSAYFTENQMLVIENERVYIIDLDTFNQTYEPVDEPTEKGE